MNFLGSATLAVVSLLAVAGIGPGLNMARAGETYDMTTLYEEGEVMAVMSSPDGTRRLIALPDGSVRIRDAASGAEIALLKGDGGVVHFAAFSPDGARLVTVAANISVSPDTTVRIWDISGGHEIAVQKTSYGVHSAAFSPDGARVVTAIPDGTAHIWDVSGSRELAILEGHERDVVDVAFSPDGKRLATASKDKTARLWDAGSGREVFVLDHSDAVNSVAFSPDGMRLVTGSNDDKARIFDAASGGEIAALQHPDDVLDANFSGDGTRVVTASYDRNARLWELGSGEEVAVLTGHGAPIHSAAFSPDGERVFTAAQDGTVRIWTKLAPASLPDGIAGLWYQNFTSPEPMPEEVVKFSCVKTPGVVHADGLIVIFDGTASELPEPVQHMRCTSELSCEIFGGPPAQGQTAQGTAKLTFTGDAGNMCVEGGECTLLARCPALTWSDEERNSGFAEAWEARVLAPVK